MKRVSSFASHCLWTIIEKIIRWSPHPRIRSCALSMCGASVGTHVRIMEIFFANVQRGFGNLKLCDSVYIGPHCIFDLTGPIKIGPRTSVSPGCLFITHADPGSMLGNLLSELYPRRIAGIQIGSDSWIGAGTVILCGVAIGNRVIVGAGAVVTKDIPDGCLAVGNPISIIKQL